MKKSTAAVRSEKRGARRNAWRFILLASLLSLLAPSLSLAQHIAAAKDVQNNFTAPQNFKNANGTRFADQFANIQAAITDAGTTGTVVIPSSYAGSDTYTNPNKINVIDYRNTTMNSSVANNSFYMRRTDNSPPVGGAGILSPYLAPMMRLDLLSQSGGVVGNSTGLLINMPGIKGKSYTTTTQIITGSGTPQTVTVADSSSISPGDIGIIDTTTAGHQEVLTITAVPSGTHITGIFTKNHASGVRFVPNFKGVEIGEGIAMADAPGNQNGLFGFNSNVTVESRAAHAVTGVEIDVTNASGVDSGDYAGDDNPWVSGLVINSAGANSSANGILITAGVTGGRSKRGILVVGSKNYGIQIGTDKGSASTTAPTSGLGIYAAKTYGIIVGSNQPIPPSGGGGGGIFQALDPVAAYFATSKGVTGTVDSNLFRAQVLEAGVTHLWDWFGKSASGGLLFQYDAATRLTIGTGGDVHAAASFYAPQYISTVATGTRPITVTSTTPVPNLTVQYAQGTQMFGTTGSIGGGALAAGACASGTVAITGATTSMVALASPSANPQVDASHGLSVWAYVSDAGTVTVNICAIVATTPNSVTYNVRVIQ